MGINSNDIRSRANVLASTDILSELLNELRCYGSINIKRTGTEDILNVIELEFDYTITFKIRMEGLEIDNKRVDNSKRAMAENALASYYSCILSNGINGLASSLDETLYGYCENFKLFVDYEIAKNKIPNYSDDVIEILSKFTLALCNKDSGSNSGVSSTNGGPSLDSLKLELLESGFHIYVNANEIKVENDDLFNFNLKVFDSNTRRLDVSKVSGEDVHSRIKHVMRNALTTSNPTIGSELSDVLDLYGINATIMSSNKLTNSVFQEYSIYVDYVIMFMLQWLGNANLSDYQGNEDSTFLYYEAMLRTKKIKRAVDMVKAVKDTSEKVTAVEFTKLDIMDFMSDLNLVMKYVTCENSYVYELIVVDMLENYLRKRQINVDVDVYGIGAIEEQREILKEFAKVLINNISE